jgi:hypothetical protein
MRDCNFRYATKAVTDRIRVNGNAKRFPFYYIMQLARKLWVQQESKTALVSIHRMDVMT